MYTSFYESVLKSETSAVIQEYRSSNLRNFRNVMRINPRLRYWKYNFVLKICNVHVLLTKREFCTGRISARGLEDTDRAQQGQAEGQYLLSTVWSSMVNTIFITRVKKKKLLRTRTDQERNCNWELSRRKLMCYAKQSKRESWRVKWKR